MPPDSARRLPPSSRPARSKRPSTPSTAGAPGQNFVARTTRGESAGRSTVRSRDAWASTGACLSSWADGTRGWSGWLDREEYPRVLDPESGRIWTANARVVDGDMLARIGDGNYEVGSRARIIRERLDSQEHFTVADPAEHSARHER